jgi:hypothetical protein
MDAILERAVKMDGSHPRQTRVETQLIGVIVGQDALALLARHLLGG